MALEPSKLQNEGEISGKGHFYFLSQTLVCTKPRFKKDLTEHWNEQAQRELAWELAVDFQFCGSDNPIWARISAENGADFVPETSVDFPLAFSVLFFLSQRIHAKSTAPKIPKSGSELMVIWKGWFETAPCRATLATPFPALCPKILGTRFTNYGLRMFWGELMVIWKGWLETVLYRSTLNTPFSALCPRSLGTRFTNYGLRVSGVASWIPLGWIQEGKLIQMQSTHKEICPNNSSMSRSGLYIGHAGSKEVSEPLTGSGKDSLRSQLSPVLRQGKWGEIYASRT